MDLLRQGADCIQRNLRLLALYLLLIAGSRTVALVVYWRLGLLNPDPPQEIGLYNVLADLPLLIITALGQAIVFAKLGEAIDRPLWKLSGTGEAMRKYFPLWLILNGCAWTLNWLSIVMGEAGSLPALLLIVLGIVYLPVGACIMFNRAFSWAEAGRIVRPLLREAPKALVVFTFSGVVFFAYFHFLLITENQRYLQPLVEIVFAYTDLLIFAATWLLCILDRQQPEDDVEF